MSTVTAVLTHLPHEQVQAGIELLEAVSPDALFVICYGGQRSEFERVVVEHKLFVDDPTLRGPEQHLQSLTRVFEALWWTYLRADESVDSLYLIEYDHLILDPRFEQHLSELAARTGADLLGKTCADRTATNDEHYIRFRRDARLLAHLHRLSVREDRSRIFGCLGDGMWISRRALEAYVDLGDHPSCYCETYVPTLLHHLGFRVVDVDAHSDLYREVRWTPPFSVQDVIARLEGGTPFIHPVKDPNAVRALRDSFTRERGT